MQLFHLAAFLLCLLAARGQNPRVCNKDTLKLCKNNINNIVFGNGNSRKMELEDQCWRIRHNFDCVLWQTSMCLDQEEQEENSDGVLKAWRFLDGFCENFKNWWTKVCYGSERLKKCENLLNSKGRSVDKASCKSYLKFRECAVDSIESECSRDDQRLMGVYLMEKGQQRAWKCPTDDSKYSDEPVNAPLAADISDVMLSDSSPTCVYNAAKQVQKCLGQFEGTRKTARDMLDENGAKKKICCAAKSYEECVLKVMKDNCGDSGQEEAKKVISTFKSGLQSDCDDSMDCSAANSLTHSALTIAFVLAFFLSNMALQLV